MEQIESKFLYVNENIVGRYFLLLYPNFSKESLYLARMLVKRVLGE